MAQSSGSIRLTVDLDYLQAVLGQVRRLNADLEESTQVNVDGLLGDLVVADVPDAVRAFSNGWHDGRDQIHAKLGTVDQLLTYAIDQYLQLENTLLAALSGESATS